MGATGFTFPLHIRGDKLNQCSELPLLSPRRVVQLSGFYSHNILHRRPVGGRWKLAKNSAETWGSDQTNDVGDGVGRVSKTTGPTLQRGGGRFYRTHYITFLTLGAEDYRTGRRGRPWPTPPPLVTRGKRRKHLFTRYKLLFLLGRRSRFCNIKKPRLETS